MALPGRETKGVRIIRRDLKTNQEQELYHSPINFLHMTLSPDGQQLAFYADSTLKLLSVTGGEPRELIRIPDITTISWTPYGHQLLYGRKTGQDDMTELWLISVENGKPQKLDLAIPELLHLRVHPQGRRIAFTARAQQQKVEVWVMENFLNLSKDDL
jgi:Tol biopolymer transport system component